MGLHPFTRLKGLPRRSRGEEPICQLGRSGFDHGFGRRGFRGPQRPHLEPALHQERSRRSETPTHPSQGGAPVPRTRGEPPAATGPSMAQERRVKKKLKNSYRGKSHYAYFNAPVRKVGLVTWSLTRVATGVRGGHGRGRLCPWAESGSRHRRAVRGSSEPGLRPPRASLQLHRAQTQPQGSPWQGWRFGSNWASRDPRGRRSPVPSA